MKKHTKIPVHAMFLSPAIICMLAVIIAPFLVAIVITFFDINLLENQGKWTFAGLKNYEIFIHDERAVNASIITLKFVFLALTIEVIIGLFLALFFDREFKGKKLVRSLLIMPMFMTPIVGGLIWRAFFDPLNGIVNFCLKTVGLIAGPMDWLGNVTTALPAVLIADAWKNSSFIFLLFMASLDSIPGDIYESAHVEGANELQIINYIKLPILIPTFFMSGVMRLVDLMKTFDLFYVMTRGGPGISTETINLYAYKVGFEFLRIGYSTTISFVFTAIVVTVLSVIIIRQVSKASSIY